MQQFYGIDCESGILGRRSARWLRTRLVGLLQIDGGPSGLGPVSRLHLALFPPREEVSGVADRR